LIKSQIKLTALLLLSLGLLACRFLFPETATPTRSPEKATRPPSSAETAVPLPEASPTLAETGNPAKGSLVIVALDPADGDLDKQLGQQAQKAFELGLLPVVEFDAEW